MAKQTLLIAVSIKTRFIAFEWLVDQIDRERYDLHFAVITPDATPLMTFLKEREVPVTWIPCKHKSDLFRVALKFRRLCRRVRPNLVHCHFMDACVAGLTGAWMAGIRHRVHTRHHAGPYTKAERPGWFWLLDAINNRFSTQIVAADELVRDVLIAEKVKPQMVNVINHGFPAEHFEVKPERVTAMRKKYGIPEDAFVVGSVARYQNLKGVTDTVRAFLDLREANPDAFLVLANAQGPHSDPVKQLLKQLPQDRYVEIPFESDVIPLYHCFDVFVHVPIAPHLEAFGLVYLEAMGCGVPMVATEAGIGLEILEHHQNAVIVPHRDPQKLWEALYHLSEDADLRQQLIAGGLKTAQEARFRFATKLRQLDELYTSLLHPQTTTLPAEGANALIES